MCIGSNSVNQAQDLMTVTKIEDLPNSLLPIIQELGAARFGTLKWRGLRLKAEV